MMDPRIQAALLGEQERQFYNIELIASENFVSEEVLALTGSLFTNKYAEGYPGRRYYGGCEYADQVENLAIEYLKALYGCEHANVQAHSGSQANMAVYMAILQPNDVVLGMDLNAGGHLTHGHKLNFSGQLYQFAAYGVDPVTQCLDYEAILAQAKAVRPKLIVAGASAYSRLIDFAKFKAIADEVGAYLMVDMAHIAGLVAAGLHPSPFPHADFVTSTTHKTLRGPRGGIVMCKAEFAKQIDMSIFPGIQGGPLVHVIAAKAQAFYEALQPEFATYQQGVLDNMATMCNVFAGYNLRMVSGGSENHLVTLCVHDAFGLSGKQAETLLHSVGITCNKNTIPNDPLPPAQSSGIRLGSAAMTSRKLKSYHFEQIAHWIVAVLSHPEEEALHQQVAKEIRLLMEELDEVNKRP
ncbi:MAG: serine hydroxymethyltransferase [Erysipelotrichaceae bacterium]